MSPTPNTFTDGTVLLIQVVNVVDGAGQPAILSVPPVWTTSNSAILTVTAATNGLSATGTAATDGTVIITATSGTLPPATTTITVVSGQAVSFQLSVSAVPPASS